MLVALDVQKRIANETVLQGVSISLREGELVGLIGESGAGKTVLARCLVGLETWDGGTLAIDELTVDTRTPQDHPHWQAVRRAVGLVAQNRALPPYRTAHELIAEGPRYVLRLSEREAKDRAANWLTRLGLTQHSHKYATELSGGQLARVCLARALAMEPKILICDEVTANLDPLMAADVAAALLSIASSGVGVLMISHQMEFLRRHATRVDFLHAGRIATSGGPLDMLAHPEDPALRSFLNDAQLGR